MTDEKVGKKLVGRWHTIYRSGKEEGKAKVLGIDTIDRAWKDGEEIVQAYCKVQFKGDYCATYRWIDVSGEGAE